MKVIINADDFGISKKVNSCIEEAIKIGVISSTTIIANGPAVLDAIEISKKYTNISFGVHLNLIEFEPLTNKPIFQKYGLLDNTGCFIEGAIFHTKLTNELKLAIKEEFEAQIEFLLDKGIHISHIDSHQHTHVIFDLQDTIIHLINKYNIKRIRRPLIMSRRMIKTVRKNIHIVFDKDLNNSNKKAYIIHRIFRYYKVLIRKLRWVNRIKKYTTLSDAFFDYRVAVFDGATIKKYFQNKTIELMCHPGHTSYKRENDLLLSNKVSEIINFSLISYHEI